MWETIKKYRDDIWLKDLSIVIMAVWSQSPDEGCVNRIYRGTLRLLGKELFGLNMKIFMKMY
nr:MAG TPA: hypothetical protein [Caudoviricetes sp.]DAH32566.1 MAG TPA: hypothetical protein [Caudoviricetes sp.]